MTLKDAWLFFVTKILLGATNCLYLDTQHDILHNLFSIIGKSAIFGTYGPVNGPKWHLKMPGCFFVTEIIFGALDYLYLDTPHAILHNLFTAFCKSAIYGTFEPFMAPLAI